MSATKEDLMEQFDLLKTEYINLLNDKDVLLNWGKPQLEALYTTKIGVYQLEKLKQQLHIKALKRKIEQVQSAVSRGEDFNVSEIEKFYKKAGWTEVGLHGTKETKFEMTYEVWTQLN